MRSRLPVLRPSSPGSPSSSRSAAPPLPSPMPSGRNRGVRTAPSAASPPSPAIRARAWRTFPDQFSSSKALFTRTFNCAGGADEVRRVWLGVYEVRFAGNSAASAVVSGSGAESWLTPMPGGVFRVGLHVPGRAGRAEAPFVVRRRSRQRVRRGARRAWTSDHRRRPRAARAPVSWRKSSERTSSSPARNASYERVSRLELPAGPTELRASERPSTSSPTGS